MEENYDMRNMLLSSKRVCVNGHDTFKTGRTKQRLCKVCAQNHSKKWHKEHPNYVAPCERQNPEYYRERALISKYGLNLAQYKDLLKKQNGKCVICHTDKEVLSVDHSHNTGKIRSLLCGNCNRGLGLFFDNPDLLKRAASYIESKMEIKYGR